MWGQRAVQTSSAGVLFLGICGGRLTPLPPKILFGVDSSTSASCPVPWPTHFVGRLQPSSGLAPCFFSSPRLMAAGELLIVYIVSGPILQFRSLSDCCSLPPSFFRISHFLSSEAGLKTRIPLHLLPFPSPSARHGFHHGKAGRSPTCRYHRASQQQQRSNTTESR